MRTRTACLGACLALLACSDSTGPAGDGSITVFANTQGGDPDLDGYDLRIDGDVSVPLSPHGNVTLTLRAGRHQLELQGVAANCGVPEGARREVEIAAVGSGSILFGVTCGATGVSVATGTTGLDHDGDGYLLGVNGLVRSTGANATTVISRLPPGTHTVQLGGVAPNCRAVGPGSATVAVRNAELSPVEFDLQCVATSGLVLVEVTTTGTDPDGEYTALLGGLSGQSTEVLGGTGVLALVPPGSHLVTLEDVAPNCAVTGEATRPASVSAGTLVRDTARVSFAVACVLDSGIFRVTTSTAGSELDAQYTVTLFRWVCTGYYDCGMDVFVSLPTGGTASVDLSARSGSYQVQLGDVAPQCTVTSPNPSGEVSVSVGGVREVHFDVLCGPAVIEVSAPTTGEALDTEYQAVIYYLDYWYYDWAVLTQFVVPANGTVAFEAPYPNYYYVELRDVAANCTVETENPAPSFYLHQGITQSVVFPVACSP